MKQPQFTPGELGTLCAACMILAVESKSPRVRSEMDGLAQKIIREAFFNTDRPANAFGPSRESSQEDVQVSGIYNPDETHNL